VKAKFIDYLAQKWKRIANIEFESFMNTKMGDCGKNFHRKGEEENGKVEDFHFERLKIIQIITNVNNRFD
jgi:hypothetical protein